MRTTSQQKSPPAEAGIRFHFPLPFAGITRIRFEGSRVSTLLSAPELGAPPRDLLNFEKPRFV